MYCTLHRGFKHALNSEGELSTRDDSDDENGKDKTDDSDPAMKYHDARSKYLPRILQVNAYISCRVRTVFRYQEEQDRVSIVQS